MQLGFRSVNIPRFQEGGPMPADTGGGEPMPEGMEGAPAEGGGGDPLMEIAQMAMQALQGQDCNAAFQVCEAFVQLIQQQGGGGAPAEQGAPAPEGEPVFRQGGILSRRIRKG